MDDTSKHSSFDGKNTKESTDEEKALNEIASIESMHEEASRPAAKQVESTSVPKLEDPKKKIAIEGMSSSRSTDDTNAHSAKRFLVAYLTSVFSALSLLFSSAFLAYVLLDHFIAEKKEESLLFSFDLAPLYISTMASIIVFAVLYLISTQYVAKKAASDTIGLRDWRAYKIIYALFSATLLVTGASVLASLVYIPLAQMMIADDLSNDQILIQVLGGVHVFVWIALLLWQERLVKLGKNSRVQGVIIAILALAVVVLTAVYPVGSKADERYDRRIENDLSVIQSEIDTYKTAHSGTYPETLAQLEFKGHSQVESRLDNYKYTVKKETTEPASAQPELSEDSDYYKYLSDIAAMQPNGNTDKDEDAASDTSDQGISQTDPQAGTMQRSFSSILPVPTTRTTYELCATFKTDTTEKDDGSSLLTGLSSITSISSYTFSSHKAGEVCFTRE